MLNGAITVKQLNYYVKTLLESDIRLSNVSVSGEISNLKLHYSSGHWYFTLKDTDASIRCVMFKSSASKVRFVPEDGMSVVLTGRVSLYEKDGQYQFYAEEMHSSGEGDLSVKFRQLKEKLLNEGLFDEESKRMLPVYPKYIAVITSDSGAALQDILNILMRRYPLCTVVLCPAIVQGEMAVSSMLDALERVYALDFIDLIIIGRGGGSAEDLQAFNDESLARKIYESPFPVVSAVGHETDFSISDFVADRRAPTPSAAAELAVPNISDLEFRVSVIQKNLKHAIVNRIDESEKRIKLASAHISKDKYFDLLNYKLLELDGVNECLFNSVNRKISQLESRFSKAVSALDALSPLKTISRGYASVVKDNNPINSIKQLDSGDRISVSLSDGLVNCLVEEVIERNDL